MIADVIVLGLGGMGSATVYELARRNLQVIGIEQFPAVHARGSSHGYTRIIREAYYEHPDYVPLVQRSMHSWQQLENQSGVSLLDRVPCVSIGPESGELIPGVRRSAAVHRLAIEDYSAVDFQAIAPMFRIPQDWRAIVEPRAGVLAVESCVRTYLHLAQQLGAELYFECPGVDWQIGSDGLITVETESATFTTRRLILTVGAWATRWLPTVPLTVMRQVQHWLPMPTDETWRTTDFPTFLLEAPNSYFYGIPQRFGSPGIKIAQHFGAPELQSPAQVDWEVREADFSPILQAVNQYLPDLQATPIASQVCMYTISPDLHFCLDQLHGAANVWFAAGFSGHGFKFAPVIAEVLADWCEFGTTQWPVEFLRTSRLAGS
ncbi:n-methyltryptophan oxidase : N-methyltryptophan oxidase, FAD-binding OS=Planctomyces maris DSM 8797 GN=PM8797T_18039 PE=4 SV=1: DAO [Tuwongella immobilis]|uniref:FAD dependent oxidoreductase domain-containing protein n=2 Tax=Tuwongella immobilis TaxID=692036 RepID=A0A6C2YP69_9BACT|nr:n-methyltryptophan oxidase : N-methyltryptophan oxidase, FAD-binding OS=Planctomyces maris DSM 8797 GN=PM8797T_18039 PE=4 SV=1: DAO [Tuwongella immobilis]VTS03669.1 n-methyltryptophan oxidase : N-methyltryptophan oxidase, FAD-binding OS=Planctomyces maris DSM 8797 GN=PM8797T_18039 PE=4 SV=1: DAO [Tuwongella immobilis]